MNVVIEGMKPITENQDKLNKPSVHSLRSCPINVILYILILFYILIFL